MLRHSAEHTGRREMWRLWTATAAPELVVAGPQEGSPMWMAWHLPKRIALWTCIQIYPKDGQAPVTTPWRRR